MKCQEFETIVNDLARDQIMDLAVRESSLAHARTCTRCAARLADERALTIGLRALAANQETEAAPARVEAALLAVFRNRATAPVVPSIKKAPTTIHQSWLRWAVAAAAAILVLLGLTAPRWLHTTQPPKPEHQVLAVPPTPTVTPVPELKPQPATPPTGRETAKVGRPVPPRAHGRVDYASHHPQTDRRLSGIAFSHELTVNASEPEVATDFLPLTFGSGLPPLESGQVVRVKVPRSALASFGLPINLERANEPVKADVLLGDDGLMRAIRFVR